MRADAPCEHFELGTQTGSVRSGAILKLLKIGQLGPRWSLPSQLARSPLAWIIEIDGLIVDARRIPRNLQEDAFRQGVIPFVPDTD
ncbi:hypothetical protein WS70_21980 [Burkholderia mayonis]|uniref:Uncharacterized protein n=1 Tax=Burkholderia mayonis TaxID=1385591 RepID=A0A1B4FLE3_9BURK|nr:hypothetical protein [Burkholderia mayonis]AOJ04493.1 hypothetical protein WS70_21980 [Burkholderia mayonis]KVE40968.1 hypothetical protein WS70_15870 [Burkholderia mayonis]